VILLIDNYDSFVYNLVQRIGELGWESVVYRSDEIALGEIEALSPSHIIISPGPCTPLEAGISNDVVRRFGGQIPILGVCLGHQCIGYVYGAIVDRAKVPMHGKASPIYHDGETIYRGLPCPFEGGRYHSLAIKPGTLPPCLQVTAYTEAGEIMGVRHRDFVVEGVQFHPESILTGVGYEVLRNFLSFSGGRWHDNSRLFRNGD